MNAPLINVEMILATGSRAGMAAPILNGYYMIGRHAECQIRPKSRSVSRRHCVVFRNDAEFKVLDLNSTSGTKINDQRIQPRTWQSLNDGDELRCGKLCFQVSIKHKRDPVQSTTITPTSNAQARPIPAAGTPKTNDSNMQVGQAWQEFDIADFLESEDDADREVRYDKIRKAHASRIEETIDDESGNLHVYEDTPLESDENTSTNLTRATKNVATSPPPTPNEETSSHAASSGHAASPVFFWPCGHPRTGRRAKGIARQTL